MNTVDIARKIMQDEGYTQESLAKKMGYANQAGICVLFRAGMTLDSLYRILQAIGGYEIVVRKKTVEYIAERDIAPGKIKHLQ